MVCDYDRPLEACRNQQSPIYGLRGHILITRSVLLHTSSARNSGFARLSCFRGTGKLNSKTILQLWQINEFDAEKHAYEVRRTWYRPRQGPKYVPDADGIGPQALLRHIHPRQILLAGSPTNGHKEYGSFVG